MKIVEFPIYPFLVVPAAALLLYANNAASFGPWEVLRHILFVTFVALALFLVLRLLIRSWSGAGAVTALIAAGFVLGPDPVLLVLAAGAASSLMLAAFRMGIAAVMTAIANVVGIVMVAIVGTNATLTEMGAGGAETVANYGPFAERFAASDAALSARPSVAHIVLDGYANSWALETLFAQDNSQFLGDLRALDFHVFDPVAAPANQTLLSMSTVMNAALPPLDHPPFAQREDQALRQLLARSIAENSVIRLFRGFGHEIVSTSTGFGLLRHPEGARVTGGEPRLGLSLFDVYFAGRLLLRWIPGVVSPSTMAKPVDRRIRNALSREVADELSHPFFLYAHILAPHPPFTLTRDGEPTDAYGFSLLGAGSHAMRGDESLQASYRRGYVEKLLFTNEALLRLVEQLIATADGPLVIIVHGDHGSGTRLMVDDSSLTCLAERMFTMAAIYTNVPEIKLAFEEHGLDNIANLYRVIGGTILGRQIPLIHDQYFVAYGELSNWENIYGMPLKANCY